MKKENWNQWELDSERWLLAYNPPEHHDLYIIPLHRLTSSAEVLDFIVQVGKKPGRQTKCWAD